MIILAILKVNLPEGEKDKFIEDMNNEIKTIEGLEAKDFHYSTSTKRTAKTTTRKDGTKETNYFLESEGLDSEVHRILVEDFAFRAQKEYKEKDYNTELKSIENIREQFESSSKSSKLTTELKGEYSSAIEQFNSNMDEIIPLEQERYLKVLEGEIKAAKEPKPKKESKIKEELVAGFDDEEADSKETGKRLYPNSHTKIIGILSEIKGSQEIVRYLKDSSTSMLDETNPINQGDKKTPRKMALAKLIMLFNKLEEESLSKSDVKAIKKLKVLLDEPYDGTKTGSLKEYTKKYMKDVGDLQVKSRTLSNLKTLLGRLLKYEKDLLAKNRETDVFKLLGRTQKEREQTLSYLIDLHKSPIQARKYDIRGSGDTFEYKEGKKAPDDTSSMSAETQGQISNEYTSDYFGYETLMEYAESINALLITTRESIMTVIERDRLEELREEYFKIEEELEELDDNNLEDAYSQFNEREKLLEEAKETLQEQEDLLDGGDLIRESVDLMETIIQDGRTKGGMVMFTKKEKNSILKNMKELAKIVETYFSGNKPKDGPTLSEETLNQPTKEQRDAHILSRFKRKESEEE